MGVVKGVKDYPATPIGVITGVKDYPARLTKDLQA
jgi:hypothetical protein